MGKINTDKEGASPPCCIWQHPTTIKVRKAGYKQLIIRLKEHSFIQNLQEKLMWGADVRE